MRKTGKASKAENTRATRLYREVGRWLSQYRQVRGLTQGQLAERAGLARTSIVNAEAGRQRLPLHTLARIARVLDVALSDLIE